MQTRLETLIGKRDFDRARGLLECQLSAGEILDPRTDKEWTPVADLIAAHISAEEGLDATVEYWEALLRFFVEVIEPEWGHAHKGHIYFRLGLREARRDLPTAKKRLGQAREEDIILRRSQGSSEQEAKFLAMQSSSYVALALLERIEDSELSSPDEKDQFIENLFSKSFDAAIQGQIVIPHLVTAALETLIPPESLSPTVALQQELVTASAEGLLFSIVSLTGAMLESVLLGVLHFGMGVQTLASGKPILEAELGPLLQEAISRMVFPSSSVQAGFRLVHIFRNRLHPGNELRQKQKLTDRVAMTVRLIFELSVVEWAESVKREEREVPEAS